MKPVALRHPFCDVQLDADRYVVGGAISCAVFCRSAFEWPTDDWEEF